MKPKRKLTLKNIVVLTLSILPFLIGLGISIYNTSDPEYFSAAINISGSQRMRPMLISNYLQIYLDEVEQHSDKAEQTKSLLETELDNYSRDYKALKYGDSELGINPNGYDEIISALDEIEGSLNNYSTNARRVIENPNDLVSYEYVITNSMEQKDNFDQITSLFQLENNNVIEEQETMNIGIILFGALVTFISLLLLVKMKEKEYHANFDYLTKLKNRHSLFEDVKKLDISEFSLFFIDLNKFKVINDTYGHDVGDEILIEVSNRLKNVFGVDFLYRYGGDEFIAFVKESVADDLENSIDNKVNEVKRMLSVPIIDSSKQNHYAGLSIGVATSQVGIKKWSDLISLSDELMYDSKTVTDNVIICNSKEELEERINFTKSFDKALAEKSIKLRYQMIKSLCTDEMKIFNVTSVWENDMEFLNAEEFLPILRRKGYLTEVDKNVFFEIERRYIEQGEQDNVQYSVNLSEETLKGYRTNGMMDILMNLKIPRDRILIKIHEELLNSEEILEILYEIKDKGYLIAVDDVIMDVSFKNIEKYRIANVIKIGNVLTKALLEKNETKKILATFIELFLSTGKKIIVEGVERETLDSIMKSQETSDYCDYIFYSPPKVNKLKHKGKSKE
ncbi:diguanylate cyclase [Eubacteriaceae bacterium ES2]|nr:diguanylate cyclase [Eubacteriaceae bacterium ES2]